MNTFANMTKQPYTLQINVSANIGSTGRIADGIGKEFVRRGYRTKIAYGRQAGQSLIEQRHIGSRLDIALHGARSLLFDGHGLGSRRATQVLVRELDDDPPDLVILHNIHGYYLNYPVLFNALKALNIPVAWVLHDCWAFTGHCAYFDRASCTRWQHGCGACPLTSQYPASLVDRSARNWELKRASFADLTHGLIITPSRWLAMHVENSFLRGWDRRVIANGVDLKAFKPGTSTSRERPIALGVASGWAARKGLQDMCALRDALPEQWRVILVGVTDAQKKRLPPGVEGVVKTQNVDELSRLYAQAAVFVNPTYIDNFPTTNLEALACGTPVVTYDTGGSPESLNDAVGAVVPQGDVKALAKAVQLWGQASRATEIRRTCRDHAERHFDAQYRFRDHVAAYEALLSG